MAFKFHCGVWVTSVVTGFKGCIVSRTEYLSGCNRYCVQPRVGEDGKNVESGWHDEHELEVDTTRQQLKLAREAEQPPG